MSANDLRKDLVKLMPGYDWTVHRVRPGAVVILATGTKSSGFNRLSTLSVSRTEKDGVVTYEAKSAGFGTKATWIHTHEDRTLARALRGLQSHYEAMAITYRGLASALQNGRTAPVRVKGCEK